MGIENTVRDLYYGTKYQLFLLDIFKYIFGFSFVVWRCFFFILFKFSLFEEINH